MNSEVVSIQPREHRGRVLTPRIKEAVVPLAALFLLTLVFGLLAPERFMSFSNWSIILQQSAVVAIVGFGMTFVIVSGCIDLSVGSVLALAGIVAAGVAEQSGAVAGVAAGLLVGRLCGLINGAAFTAMKVPSFIATLGMMSIARGLTIIYSSSSPIVVWNSFEVLGAYPAILYIAGAAFVGAYVLYNYTIIGRYCQAIGGNERVARLSGVPVTWIKLSIFLLSGVMAGLGGIVLAARLGAATPTSGLMFELDAISAVVLGGTPLTGGIGGMHSTVIGALITSLLANGLVILGVPSEVQIVIRGAILILAVFVSLNRTKIGVIK